MRTSAALTFLLSLLLSFASSQALAQASRTWVSGVGDDANPCSRTAPCKTFAGAISKTAAHGEISVLDPGGYGALTITKSITIDGDGSLASILVSGTNGINVSAGVSDVVIIRNISINGIGAGLTGIKFFTGGKLHVENVKIYGFTQQGIDFAPSGASSLFVSDTSIRNTAIAVWARPTASGQAVVTLNRVSMDGNGTGMRVDDGTLGAVRDSEATGNDADGFAAVSASRAAVLSLEGCVSSQNSGAGVLASGTLGTARISNVNVTRNAFGLLTIGGGSIVSFGNNRVIANNANNGPPTAMQGQM